MNSSDLMKSIQSLEVQLSSFENQLHDTFSQLLSNISAVASALPNSSKDELPSSFEILEEAILKSLNSLPYATLSTLHQEISEQHIESLFRIDYDDIECVLDKLLADSKIERIIENEKIYYRI